ncbi:MAG: energy transducer TonB [Bacteroidales bacterium]|nr:energy transducer TonB [Bacteroidales bacterium]
MKGITEILVLMLLFPFFAEAQIEYMCIDPSEDDEPVYDNRSVEKKAAYPGGYHGLQKDIEENLVYPEDAKKNGIQGIVVVAIVVDKEGQITKPKIILSPAHVLDSAALEVIPHLKPFTPGEQHGEKVNVYYGVPIYFKLDK